MLENVGKWGRQIAALAWTAFVSQINKGSRESESMERPVSRPQGCQGKAAEGRRTGGRIEPEDPMTRFVAVMSHVAELGVFFAAAAALGAGLLKLR